MNQQHTRKPAKDAKPKAEQSLPDWERGQEHDRREHEQHRQQRDDHERSLKKARDAGAEKKRH